MLLDHHSICDTNRAHMAHFPGDARLALAVQGDAFSSSSRMALAPWVDAATQRLRDDLDMQRIGR